MGQPLRAVLRGTGSALAPTPLLAGVSSSVEKVAGSGKRLLRFGLAKLVAG